MKSTKFTYTSLILQISPCTQKCKHCFMSTLIEKPRSFDNVKKMIDNYARVLDDTAITDSARIAIQDEPTLELEGDWHSISIPFYSETWDDNSSIAPSIEDLALLPKQYLKKIESSRRSESQWIKMCSDKEDISKHLPDSEENPDHRSKGIYERYGILYDYHWDLPQFQLGNIMEDSLRDIYLSEDRSPGMQLWLESDVSALAEKYGNKENSRLDYLMNYWFMWCLKSDEMNNLKSQIATKI